MSMKNQIVLVAGGNRGIGKALAGEALARGAKRVYVGTRQPFVHPDPRLVPLIVDVTDPAQVQAIADKVEALDILINNAGVMVPDNPFEPCRARASLGRQPLRCPRHDPVLAAAADQLAWGRREPPVLRRACPVADVHVVLRLEGCGVLFDQGSSCRSRCAGRPLPRGARRPDRHRHDTRSQHPEDLPRSGRESDLRCGREWCRGHLPRSRVCATGGRLGHWTGQDPGAPVRAANPYAIAPPIRNGGGGTRPESEVDYHPSPPAGPRSAR